MNNVPVIDTLERLCALLRTDVRQRGLPHGLRPVQVEALLYLGRCNRYSDTPLAVTEFLGSTKGTVSQTLKVLEREGLLTKRADPEDRRIVRLQLTPAGRKLTEELAVPPALERALVDDRVPTDTLAADLQRLLTGMQRATGHKTFGTCHTCRFFGREASGYRCGLTKEPLSPADSILICREHQFDSDEEKPLRSGEADARAT
ncbi:MAG: MarR family transcriptional regulator [Thermoanaerobaculia bacterium]|nr:MarR family transcriptional regulator [Thermoanaerobaculia bacterium]